MSVLLSYIGSGREARVLGKVKFFSKMIATHFYIGFPIFSSERASDSRLAGPIGPICADLVLKAEWNTLPVYDLTTRSLSMQIKH